MRVMCVCMRVCVCVCVMCAGEGGECVYVLLLVAEEAKNKQALDVVMRIMRNATWINIHSLPVCA